MSEIDDIFASKKQPPSPKEKKKKKPSNVSLKTDVLAPPSRKRPLPETVVDTSDLLPGPSKRLKAVPAPPDNKNKKPKKLAKKMPDADAEFKDSRGSETRRKTEEGWLIYKEDELGIGDQGGDQTRLFVLLIVNAVFECHKVAHTMFYPPCSIISFGSFEASLIGVFTIDRLGVWKLWP